ncbi:MAG: hypothetical protein J5764_00220 [Bacteroidales bacterium]|nr:hypothetical protein [Bacteroidales bacterium]
MKKTYRFFAIVLSVIVAASCTVKGEFDTPSIPENGTGTLKLVIEDVSKTYVEDLETPGSHAVKWSGTEAVSVNGVAVNVLEVSADGLTATIPSEGLEAPYRAFYPASAVVDGSFVREVATVVAPGDTTHTGYKASDGKYYDWLKADFPAVQNYVAGGYDPAAALMSASRDDDKLTFHHHTAFLKVIVGGETSNIRRLVLRNGVLTRGMTGTFSYVFKGDDIISSVVSDVTETLTLDCGEDGVAPGTPILVAVPARNYSSGLVISAENVDGESCSIKSSALNTLDYPGAIITVPMEFNPTGAKGYIRTAGDWSLFVSDVNNGVSLDRWMVDGVVKLDADLEVEDLPRMTAEWTGIFDGQDHIIKQTKANGPLFGVINGGTVKQLILKGDMHEDMEDSSNPGYCSVAVTLKGNGTISNVHNMMDMTADVSGKHIAMAGICRQVLSGTISDCYNLGKITADYVATTTANVYAGGIVAMIGDLVSLAPLEGPVTISNCVNYNDISLKNQHNGTAFPMHYNALGGIVAWILGGDETNFARLNGCANYGKLTNTRGHLATNAAPNLSAGYVGGMVGCAYMPAKTFTYTNNNKNYSSPVGRSFACPYGAKKWVAGEGTEEHQDGIYFELYGCVNYGNIVHEASASSAVASSTIRFKHYSGGLIGLAFGKLSRHALLENCANGGNVGGGSSYSRSAYTAVNGGLVGLAGALDVTLCAVGDKSTPAVIGGAPLSFANGGIFGIMPVQCNVDCCDLNLNIIASGTGHDSMPYFAALAAMVVGGTSAQGGYLKDTTDPTLYYAGSSFQNVKVKGSISHGKTQSALTTDTFDAETTAGMLFCSYDTANADVQAFDMTGTGLWN